MASESFEEYRKRNPGVETLLYELALRELAKLKNGRRHLSMKHLWEIARLHYANIPGGREFKYSNDHTPDYARLLMRQHPDLAGVFVTKTRRKGETPIPKDDTAKQIESELGISEDEYPGGYPFQG